MFAGKKSAQIREILISESAWEEMTCLFAPSLESVQQNEGFKMTKKTVHSQITKTQIYRSVASSTAIETGVSVQKIEQQLKQNQAQAKAVGLAR